MSLFNELKRRNVIRVAMAYVVASWLIIQVVETILPAFGYSDVAIRYIVIVLAIAFVPTLVFSWAFEITPEGVKREVDVIREHSITRFTGKKLDRVIMVLLALALGYFAFDKFVLDSARHAELVEETTQQVRSDVLVESYGDNSIAVLPFVDMSSDKDQEYMSDGIAEELLNLLAKIPELRVISRTSAFSFKGKEIDIPTIAQQLNVTHVLEGSVRKVGNQIRITTQLIEARSDTHLWSQTYDRTLGDIFVIQDEIAATVVDQLKVTLLGEVPRVQNTNPEAYALYLQAKHLLGAMTAESLQVAVTLLKEVLSIDPDYVPAWLQLGAGYDRLGSMRLLPLEEAQKLSFEAFERALDIAPNSAKALDSLAWKLSRHRGDLETAANLYDRALSLDPSNTSIIGNVSMFLSSLGRMEDSIKFGEYQVSRDPANAIAYNNLGMRYRFAGHLDKAEKTFSTALRLSPTFPGLNYELGVTKLLEGDYASAIRVFEDESIAVFKQIGMAMAFHDQGEYTLSLELLNELISSYGEMIPYYIAHIMAYRGDLDGAFEWLETAKLTGDSVMSDEAHNEPLLANIHADPRWLPFLERIGKAPAQLAAIEFNVTLPE